MADGRVKGNAVQREIDEFLDEGTEWQRATVTPASSQADLRTMTDDELQTAYETAQISELLSGKDGQRLFSSQPYEQELERRQETLRQKQAEQSNDKMFIYTRNMHHVTWAMGFVAVIALLVAIAAAYLAYLAIR